MAKTNKSENKEMVLKEESNKYRNLSFRGQSFVGVVVSSKPMKSATVEIDRKYFIPKYERYEKRLTRLHVHNPPSINAKEGDIVKVMETRPLSKTIHHVIVEKVGVKADYKGKKMIEEEEKEKIIRKKADDDKKASAETAAKGKQKKSDKKEETGNGEN